MLSWQSYLPQAVTRGGECRALTLAATISHKALLVACVHFFSFRSQFLSVNIFLPWHFIGLPTDHCSMAGCTWREFEGWQGKVSGLVNWALGVWTCWNLEMEKVNTTSTRYVELEEMLGAR